MKSRNLFSTIWNKSIFCLYVKQNNGRLQLTNPKQWATSNFERHLNGGSLIVKFVCLVCIHPSCEHATILMRKIYPKFKSGLWYTKEYVLFPWGEPHEDCSLTCWQCSLDMQCPSVYVWKILDFPLVTTWRFL